MKILIKKLDVLKHVTLCTISWLSWTLLLMFVALSSTQVIAQEREWWFDIEVIVYKRNIPPNDVLENFERKLRLVDTKYSLPLLRDYIRPDLNYLYQSLPVCFANPEPVKPLQAISEYDVELDSAPDITDLTLLHALAIDTEQSEEQNLLNERQVTLDSTLPLAQTTPSADENLPQINMAALNVWIDAISPTKFLAPDPIMCRMENETAPEYFVEKVPKLITSREWPILKQAQLLSLDNLQLGDFARDINRQRGLSVMSHFGWRQQVFFGQENATPLHLFAGENFVQLFNADGTRKSKQAKNNDTMLSIESDKDLRSPSSVDGVQANTPLNDSLLEITGETDPQNTEPTSSFSLVDNIREAIANEQFKYNPDDYIDYLDQTDESSVVEDALMADADQKEYDLWELDGNLKIFLRYIQRTPYLHIDGDIDFRAPVFDAPLYVQNEPNDTSVVTPGLMEPDRLQSYPFQQLRRVISKQIHYFDHPLFGLVIQIRRYDFPVDSETE